MKKNFHLSLLLILLLMISSSTLHSQESSQQKSREFWRRVSVGGNFGFQLGSVTGIVISPEVRFRAVDQLYFGLGFTYQYLRYKDYYYDLINKDYIDFKSNVYGGRIFTRYYLSSLFDNALGNIFAHIEYEYLTYTRPYVAAGPPPDGSIADPYGYYYRPGKQRMEFNSVFVGGGYSQPVGGKAFIEFMLLFNLNDSYNSPYSNPIFRLGFGVGL